MYMHKALLLTFFSMMTLCGLSYAFELGPVEIHGFISQGYLKTSHNNYLAQTENGTTEFNEAAVNISADLSDKLRIGLQFLARDLGDAGNDKVGLDWGFADYHWRDELGLRVGKIKRPLGFYNEGRDVDMLRTCILLPQSIYHEELRDIMNAAKGGAIYGTLAAGKLGSFDYQNVYGSEDVDLNPVNLKNQFAAVAPGVDPDSVTMNVKYSNTANMVWYTPLKGLSLGITYDRAKFEVHAPAVPATPTNNPDVFIPAQPARTATIDVTSYFIVSAEYHWRNLTLAAEYLEQDNEVDLGLAGYPLIKYGTQGYYGSIDYRFKDWLAVATYYSVYYPNRKDKHGDEQAALGNPDFKAWQKDACLSVRIDLTPNWLCKLEGHHINGVAQVFDYDDPNELVKVWSLYAAKVTCSF